MTIAPSRASPRATASPMPLLLPVTSATLPSSSKSMTLLPRWCETYEERTMSEAITHLKVPMEREEREVCLGPDGSVAHVTRVLRMISGRWKLPILFRLFAEPSMRTSQLLRDIPGISQKMLTQHLRELEKERLVARRDWGEQPPRVELGRGRSRRRTRHASSMGLQVQVAA